MTHDEAMKLARSMKKIDDGSLNLYEHKVNLLCEHILSGDYKREIENAAYIHAANRCSNGRVGKWCAAQIRSLIQPLAQKENGE